MPAKASTPFSTLTEASVAYQPPPAVLTGWLLDGDDIARFIAAQNDAYRQLQCPANQHVTLVDIRDMQIQSQDSVLEVQKRVADPRVAARRIAFLVSRSLARMQIKRAATGRPASLFTSEEEAMAWLEAAEGCPVDTRTAVVGHT